MYVLIYNEIYKLIKIFYSYSSSLATKVRKYIHEATYLLQSVLNITAH